MTLRLLVVHVLEIEMGLLLLLGGGRGYGVVIMDRPIEMSNRQNKQSSKMRMNMFNNINKAIQPKTKSWPS
jgi:hypothetical protein